MVQWLGRRTHDSRSRVRLPVMTLPGYFFQCWQVSASIGLNLGLNRFKPSWQKQVSTRVSAALAETGFCRFGRNRFCLLYTSDAADE